MRRLLALLICCVGTLLAADKAAPDVKGHWTGVVTLSDGSARVAFDIACRVKNDCEGSFEFIDQSVLLSMSDLVVSGTDVSFRLTEMKNPWTVSGALDSAGLLVLTATGADGQKQTITAERTGAAKVQRKSFGSVVDSKYEGDFQGTLPQPGEEIPFVLHIRNLPDRTVSVSFDSPARGVRGYRLSDVSIKDGKLFAGVRASGSTLTGTFSADARTIAAIWTAYGVPVHFKLTRVPEKKTSTAPSKAAPAKAAATKK